MSGSAKVDYDRSHPDTACYGVSGGVDAAPIGRRAIRGTCPSKAEVAAMRAAGAVYPPAGFTGLWGDRYYHRGQHMQHLRYAGAHGVQAATKEILSSAVAQ